MERATVLSRRNVLAFGLGAFCLPQGAIASPRSPAARGAILVVLDGGMSQLETWDPKPAAPPEIRGEFATIETAVPGLRIGEHTPLMALELQRGNIIRSVHCDARNDHSPGLHLLLTGYENVGAGVALERANFRNPSVGSVLASRLGVANADGVPRFVTLPRSGQLNGQVNYNGPSFLGVACEAFETGDAPRNSQLPLKVPLGLTLPIDMPVSRLRNRIELATMFNGLREHLDRVDSAREMDAHYQRAVRLLTGRRAQQAFEMERESADLRRSYGDHPLGQGLLLARRLIEAGATYVVVNAGCEASWDTHANNFKSLKNDLLPPMDRGVSALLRDLDERNLLDEVLVLVAGEMGRTPIVNAAAGRDHWTTAYSIFLAGGGLTRGQVLGSTTPDARYPASRPMTVHDVLATVYHQLGVDPESLLVDSLGRPVPILPEGQPITELIA
ncbi:MAG: DUF1501 domain-containing protein [Planctomycetia bacterium]|nr:DUF1501 domain-containing protein [Planctomycetia bacterium]